MRVEGDGRALLLGASKHFCSSGKGSASSRSDGERNERFGAKFNSLSAVDD